MILALAKCFTRFASSGQRCISSLSLTLLRLCASLYHAVERCRQCKSKRDTTTIAYSPVHYWYERVTARVFVFSFLSRLFSLSLSSCTLSPASCSLPAYQTLHQPVDVSPPPSSFAIHSLVTGLLSHPLLYPLLADFILITLLSPLSSLL